MLLFDTTLIHSPFAYEDNIVEWIRPNYNKPQKILLNVEDRFFAAKALWLIRFSLKSHLHPLVSRIDGTVLKGVIGVENICFAKFIVLSFEYDDGEANRCNRFLVAEVRNHEGKPYFRDIERKVWLFYEVIVIKRHRLKQAFPILLSMKIRFELDFIYFDDGKR